jgi:hypothetical protein
MRQYIIAAAAGAAVAWMGAVFVLYAVFVAGGYTREALVEPPAWVLLAIPGGGSLAGLALAWQGRRSTLPSWTRPVALGALVGVAVVVFAAEVVSSFTDGPKGPGIYRHAALVYGVPIAVVVGAAVGALRARRKSVASSS